jgi:uncharacterized membrane protein YgdD (TMEM256/DUF423 family)
MSISRKFMMLGGLLAALAVTLGAFGAHALTGMVSEARLATWQTGVEYHLFHAAGLVLVGLTADRYPGSAMLRWSGWIMFAGVIIFSGTLYALVLMDMAWLGAVTPLGGASLIIAWLFYIVGVVKSG